MFSRFVVDRFKAGFRLEIAALPDPQNCNGPLDGFFPNFSTTWTVPRHKESNSAGNRLPRCNSCRLTTMAGGTRNGHLVGTASAGSPQVRRRKDFTMRLAKYSLLAVSALMTFSGCAAYRSAGKATVNEPSDTFIPPRHTQEFDPPGESEYRLNPPHDYRPNGSAAPIQPPPVPPAIGISRVKSVGLIRDLGTRVSSSFRGKDESCVPSPAPCVSEENCGEGCVDSSQKRRFGSCFTKVFSKTSLFRLKAKPVCGENTFDGFDCGESHKSCLPGLIRPDCMERKTVCAPQPGCADACSNSPWDYRSERPCLADSLSDPFLDENCEQIKTLPTDGFDRVRDRSVIEPSNGPSDSAPQQVVPAPPVLPETSEQNNELPIWPKLESEHRVRAAQASLGAREIAVPVFRQAELPLITPRATR